MTDHVIKTLLRYDGETGKLFWLPRPASMFADSGWGQEYSARAWNARYAGKEAFTSVNNRGYRHGAIFGKTYTAHRVAWFLQNGEWPSSEIDHVNGDRCDNRAVNLRNVSTAINRKNACRSVRNTSGVVGVSCHRPSGRWVASIMKDYRVIRLGYFNEFDEAVSARKKAEIECGYHPNHGRSAA